MAVFLSNTQKFNESIATWQLAIDRVGHDVQMRQTLVSKQKEAQYGLAGQQRDMAYDEGKGNLTLALSYIDQQLSLRSSPDVLHQRATLKLMLGNEQHADAAQDFKEAVSQYLSGWYYGQRVLGRACKNAQLREKLHKAENVASLAKIAAKDEYAATIHVYVNGSMMQRDVSYAAPSVLHYAITNAAINGPDAVVTGGGEKCWIRTAVQGYFMDLGRNIQALRAWEIPNVKTVDWTRVPAQQAPWFDYHKGRAGMHGRNPNQPAVLDEAVLAVGMTTRSYYHFVTECLVRLSLIDPTLSKIKILVPEGPAFINDYLDLLNIDTERRVAYNAATAVPDTMVQVGKLHVTDWTPLRLDSERYHHSLTPRSALKHTQTALWSAAAADQLEQRPLVLFTSREACVSCTTHASAYGPQTARMRQLANESKLLERLTTALQGVAEVQVFRSQDLSVIETIQLFRQAKVVVGVHGGALANTLFCQPDTHVVELGFDLDIARHYEHMAIVLGQQYTKILLEHDQRGLGAPSVSLSKAAMDAVYQTVADAFPST
eukprot:TRINITY_DN10886_c0_g1_i1.p1 TRINITY_DN10886_c0_g1~~TRINITY_DN10886_c0_g1_i1.p1  ORF type:complete len:591 (+),score=115.72 TRINITY_DN10886_c0_g1_i1:140-1774(+)